MKKSNHFCADLQRYIAETAIGPSSLRNQGANGVIRAARDYLADLDLTVFRGKNERSFLRTLDTKTEELRQALPWGARNWGAARKALNIFLRDICYNRFLCERLGLSDAQEEWMEIPLDATVANALISTDERGELPSWPGLIRLTPEVSADFQKFAKEAAAKQNITRIHLDMRLWTKERAKKRT